MKKVHLMSWLILFFSLFPSVLQAQSYNELWKEVEAAQKKDLPKTVIGVVDKIYTKAKNEKNRHKSSTPRRSRPPTTWATP